MSILNLKGTLFQLPSQGIGYEGLIDLISGDSVKIRPFVAGDQKVMAVRGQDPFRSYSAFLEKIIVEPKIDISKLLVSDANAILFAARMMSLGSDYNISYRCENCDSQEVYKTKIDEILVNYADDLDEFNPQENIFTLRSGDKIVYRLPRLGDETSITQIINQNKKRGAQVSDLDATFIRLAKLISKINKDDIDVYLKAVRYLEEMPWGDFQDFIEDSVKKDVGMSSDTIVSCSNCGWDNEVKIAMNAEFFRPRTDRK